MIENELSFLVKKLPSDLENYPKKEIRQGYYSDMPSPLRIRDESSYFTLTKKIPIDENDRSRYQETEMPIKEEEFKRLWPHCTKSLTKTRYYYPLGKLTAEIDVYHGRLEGLVTVEVEFPDEASREEFTSPEWFGLDISQEDWSANSILSEMDYNQVMEKVKEMDSDKK